MDEISTKLLESKIPALLKAFPAAILGAEEFRGDLTVVVDPKKIREIVQFLKVEPSIQFQMMMDLFAMDYEKVDPPTPERFAVIYILVNIFENRRVRLKVFLPEENPCIDSIHDIFKAANWFEREAWDLFGIVFTGHPNQTRILCHTEFVGHPLRKDYPSEKYQRLRTVMPSQEM